MKPTVGRIVQYTSLGDRDGKFPPEVQAAIITAVRFDGPTRPTTREEEVLVNDEAAYTCSLHIFYKTGQFDMDAEFTLHAPGSEEARGKWAWPPRA